MRMKWRILTITALAALMWALVCGAQAEPEVIAYGQWGTCPWELNEDGVLQVYAGVGADTNQISPWNKALYQSTLLQFVREIRFSEGVVLPENCSGLFRLTTNAGDPFNQLERVDLRGVDASRVTDMQMMFYGCRHLKEVDMSGLNACNVTSMYMMFHSCTAMTRANLSNMDTRSLTTTRLMFYNCASLANLEMSGWNYSSLTDVQNMFMYCTGFVDLDLNFMDVSHVTYFTSMLYGCSSLVSLDISGFDTRAAKAMNGMFTGCSSLKRVVLGDRFTFCGATTTVLGNLPKYDINNHRTEWFSETDQVWYTVGHIAKNRKLMADVYTKGNDDDYIQMEEVTVTVLNARLPYNGLPQTPEVLVTWNDETLIEGVDYTLTNASRTIVGSTTLKVKGMGKFTGTVSARFRIVARSLTKYATVHAMPGSFVYDGTAKQPVPAVMVDGNILVPNRDFTVEYADNVAAGTATVSVLGIGNYTGKASAVFTILPAQIDESAVSVTLTDMDYTGLALTPKAVVTVNGAAQTVGTDYEIVCTDNVEAGTAQAQVIGRGNWAYAWTGTFEIRPAAIGDAEVQLITARSAGGTVRYLEAYWNGRMLAQGTDYVCTDGRTLNGIGSFIGTVTTSGAKAVSLTKLMTLPEDVARLDDGAFSGAVAQVVYVPAGCTDIGAGAFARCKKLRLVVFENGNAAIGADAFAGCPSLTICAPAGGSVEAYAKANRLSFIER